MLEMLQGRCLLITKYSCGLWKGRGLLAFRHFFGEEMIHPSMGFLPLTLYILAHVQSDLPQLLSGCLNT